MPPWQPDGAFTWLVPPPDLDAQEQDLTWYCDGSLVDGKWPAIRCSGFGVAAVSNLGDLVAYGLGWPPSWCDTAAAAEAWALLEVLTQCPFVPHIRTDCLALLTTAKAGTAGATHHNRPLARIWCRIAHVLDGDVAELVSSGKVVWMPAHKSHTAIGNVHLSNGAALSATDWRANRLVDSLAKAAASSLAAPRDVAAFLRSADAAAAHAACLLGIVTHAANNHQALVDGDGGGHVMTISRDSTDRPRTFPSSSSLRAESCPPAVAAGAPVATPARSLAKSVAPWRAPTPQVHANRLAKSASERALVRRVEEIGALLRPASSKQSASSRMLSIAARVREKQHLSSTVS